MIGRVVGMAAALIREVFLKGTHLVFEVGVLLA
jgi:hypothetical protein